jgi:MFS family permease
MPETHSIKVSPITGRLQQAGQLGFSAYTVAVAFALYFCMYAFRRPFAAGSYGGEDHHFAIAFGAGLTFKSVFAISQMLGYMTSKYLGTKFCSETHREQVFTRLVVLIGIAEISLILFGLLPGRWKALALVANGLPLGMVWGLVVRILEGRRTSEILLAGLSSSYILASGYMKAFGLWLLQASGCGEFWMPALAGAAFLPLFILFAWLLGQIPKPNPEDVAERSARPTMQGKNRWIFLRTFLPGLAALAICYFFLTAYRDFRDNFQADMFVEMGLANTPESFLRTETPIAFIVTGMLILLYFIRDNRKGLIFAHLLMIGGMLLMAVSTLLFQRGAISGVWWMSLSGMGSYLAYVPFGSVLFDRTISHTRHAGTAVFAIYLMDAVGYMGAVAITVWKDFAAASVSRLEFFSRFTWFMAAFGACAFLFSLFYFVGKGPPSKAR